MEVQDRFKQIEAKYGKIKSLDDCDFTDEQDPRANLIRDLLKDVGALDLKPHQLLLFRQAMDAALDVLFKIRDIMAQDAGRQQLWKAGFGDLLKRPEEGDE